MCLFIKLVKHQFSLIIIQNNINVVEEIVAFLVQPAAVGQEYILVVDLGVVYGLYLSGNFA